MLHLKFLMIRFIFLGTPEADVIQSHDAGVIVSPGRKSKEDWPINTSLRQSDFQLNVVGYSIVGPMSFTDFPHQPPS